MRPAACRSASDTEFLAGRDLAVEMLWERVYQRWTGDEVSIEAKYRDGAPQRNIALAYLQRIIETPALAEGFAAVLSDGLYDGFSDVQLYQRLAIGEMRGAEHDASLQSLLSTLGGVSD